MSSLIPRSGTSLARDPFSLMDAFFNDWLPAQRQSTPLTSRARVEITERPEAYQVRAELPGVAKEDVKVEVEGSWVSINAKRQAKSERKDGEKVLYSECTDESYSRSFELPQQVDAEQTNAVFENGVLTLTLPKRETKRSTRVEVR